MLRPSSAPPWQTVDECPARPRTPGFVDLETSGANFANDRIIEIGLIEVDQSGAREWSVLVNPERPLSPFITGLTGIDDAMLGSRPFSSGGACAARQAARTLVHRPQRPLRLRFPEVRIQAAGDRFPGANPMYRQALAQAVSRSITGTTSIPWSSGMASAVAGSRHRALADARVLWDLWRCWHRLLPVEAIRSAVATIVGRPQLPAQLDAALIDDLPEAAGAYALYDEDGRLLLVRRSDQSSPAGAGAFRSPTATRCCSATPWRIEWRDAAGELGARLRAIELAGSASPGDPAPPATRRGQRHRRGGHRALFLATPELAEGDFRPQLVFSPGH
ncbi:MAG: 3'-5' exonuclease [Candidatus Accumulibacter sp.]|nr:3'-5' exonuclease [Accumulibacter sp.]